MPAAGLIPQLLGIIRRENVDMEIQIVEQKTIHLLPKLLSGSLDIVFCRPPDMRDPKIIFRTLFFETAVVALPENHALAGRDEIDITDLADEPLIVPDRRSRPHSHDLTIKLFLDSGMTARIAQVAEEKQTIVNLVAVGAGLAIVPRWTSRLAVPWRAFRAIANLKGGDPVQADAGRGLGARRAGSHARPFHGPFGGPFAGNRSLGLIISNLNIF